MSLQIVTIKISHATPGFLLGPLNEALQDIRSRLARIEDERHRSPDGYNLKEDDEDPLVELARDALRSGTTLYNASVAESSIGADSMMGGEKAAHIGKWIRETGDAAQNTYVAPDDRSRLTPGSGSVKAQNTHTSVEAAISEAYSSQAASKAGSFSRDDSQFQLPPVPEEKPAPTVKPSDLRRLPTDFSRPLNQWDRSEVVSFFGIKPDGRWDVEICTGIKTTSEQLRSILKNAVSKQVFDLVRKRNMLSLHLAVLFQDLHLVQFLVQVGYSPNLSAQGFDRKLLREFIRPVDIAIASHCQPITEFLMNMELSSIPNTGAHHVCSSLHRPHSTYGLRPTSPLTQESFVY
jgi:hypothetical protein